MAPKRWRVAEMNADIERSGRVVEVCFQTNRAVVRFEGMPPDIGQDVLFVGLPVEWQYHYPDGSWRCSDGGPINGMKPDRGRPLYAEAPVRDDRLPQQRGASLVQRISAYLLGGGLFSPELADHDSVRALLIDCREALSAISRATGTQA